MTNQDLYQVAGIDDVAEFYREKFHTGSVLAAQYFDALDRFDMRYARTMWVYDNIRPRSSLLDLGCGEGLLALLKRKDVSLAGVDISSELLGVARRNGYDHCVKSSLTHLPFPAHSFDYVVSLDVLGHIAFAEKDRVLAEIKRVLRPAGVTLHGIETLDRERHGDYSSMSREQLRRFVQIDGHIGLETEAETKERFARFFAHVKDEPRYALCLSAEELIKQSDLYGVPCEDDFLRYLRGLSPGERRAFDMAMGYVFGKVSDFGIRLPSSGLYLFLKASAQTLGPFYNEHRDRRALFAAPHTPSGRAFLDQMSRAEFGSGWYATEDLPPAGRWMGESALVTFTATAPAALRLDLTTHIPELATQPLPLEFRLNNILLSAFSLIRYGWLDLEIYIPADLASQPRYQLEIRAARTWRPADATGHEDRRRLSIAVCNLEIISDANRITSKAAKPRTTSAARATEAAASSANKETTTAPRERTLSLPDLDYKKAAIEYPRRLDAISRGYLYTKPFYPIEKKPAGEKFGIAEETHRYFRDFADIAYALSLSAGARILDVGCGPGWMSEYFARFGYDVTGIDISPQMIAVAQERVARLPFGVDLTIPLRSRFIAHDIERAPLPEVFDAIICYDALHHFADEQRVFENISAMLDYGGLLFIIEGEKPPTDSAAERELLDEMRDYHTLESPYSRDYLLALLDRYGFKVIGDFVSLSGLPQRDMLDDEGAYHPELTPVNHLLCKKMIALDTAAPARSQVNVPDSRAPGVLRAALRTLTRWPRHVAAGDVIEMLLEIENIGDTLWLVGPTTRRGAVTLGYKLFDAATGRTLDEAHAQPPLRQALAPRERVTLRFSYRAPFAPGQYTLKIDLIAQHICWFEQTGSQPLSLAFKVF